MRRLRLEGKEAGFRGFRFQVLGGGGLAIENMERGSGAGPVLWETRLKTKVINGIIFRFKDK